MLNGRIHTLPAKRAREMFAVALWSLVTGTFVCCHLQPIRKIRNAIISVCTSNERLCSEQFNIIIFPNAEQKVQTKAKSLKV